MKNQNQPTKKPNQQKPNTHTHAHTKKKENKKTEKENKQTSTQIRKEGTHTLSDKGIRKKLMQWLRDISGHGLQIT